MEPVILFPITIDQLKIILQDIIRQEVRSHCEEAVQDRMLSPKETCKLFYPVISTMTLHTWTKNGYLIKHSIGGRVYYKYSEIMAAMKVIKRYQRIAGASGS